MQTIAVGPMVHINTDKTTTLCERHTTTTHNTSSSGSSFYTGVQSSPPASNPDCYSISSSVSSSSSSCTYDKQMHHQQQQQQTLVTTGQTFLPMTPTNSSSLIRYVNTITTPNTNTTSMHFADPAATSSFICNTPLDTPSHLSCEMSFHTGDFSLYESEKNTPYLNKSVSFMANSASLPIELTTNHFEPSMKDAGQFYTGHKKREKIVITSTSRTNLYMRGLDENTTDQDLYDLCEKYGEIKSTKAIVDKQTNKCKGYGFVDFRKHEDAKTALSELKKEQKDVQLAKQREQDPTNLYFANLPADIDEQCLNDMLKNKFNAKVNSTRVMREKNGVSKGVGFARIDDDKLCHKIIQELNGQPFPNNSNTSRLIMVKLADSCSIVKPSKHHTSHKGAQTASQPVESTSTSNSLNHSNSVMVANNGQQNMSCFNFGHHYANHSDQHSTSAAPVPGAYAPHPHVQQGQFNCRNLALPPNVYTHAPPSQPTYVDYSYNNQTYPMYTYDQHQTSIVSPVPPVVQAQYNGGNGGVGNMPLVQSQSQFGAQTTPQPLITQRVHTHSSSSATGQPVQYVNAPPPPPPGPHNRQQTSQQYLPPAHYAGPNPTPMGHQPLTTTTQPYYHHHPAQTTPNAANQSPHQYPMLVIQQSYSSPPYNYPPQTHYPPYPAQAQYQYHSHQQHQQQPVYQMHPQPKHQQPSSSNTPATTPSLSQSNLTQSMSNLSLNHSSMHLPNAELNSFTAANSVNNNSGNNHF